MVKNKIIIAAKVIMPKYTATNFVRGDKVKEPTIDDITHDIRSTYMINLVPSWILYLIVKTAQQSLSAVTIIIEKNISNVAVMTITSLTSEK